MQTTAPLAGARAEWDAKIKLVKGVNNIMIEVLDRKGAKDVQSLRVKYHSELGKFYDKVWAVVIAVDDYKAARVTDLTYAVKDGRAFEEMMRKEFFVSRIISLYDKEATSANIRAVLTGQLMDAGKKDAVVIFFAGHGVTLPGKDGAMGYLVPYDGSLAGEGRTRLISMYMLKQEVAKVCPARTVLVIAGSCYSGLMAQRDIRPVEAKRRKLGQKAYLDWLSSRGFSGVITAGEKDERVFDRGPGGYSTFAGPLLKALHEADGFISASDLFTRIKPKVVEASRAKGQVHTPCWATWFDDGDFLFIKR